MRLRSALRRFGTQILVALLCASASACGSLTTVQTPRTVGAGQTRGGALVAVVAAEPRQAQPAGAVNVRHGVSRRVDVGFKLDLPVAAVSGDVKFMLLRGPFDIAVGPAIGVNPTGAWFAQLPLYFGLNIGTRAVIGFGPKLMYVRAPDSQPGPGATCDGECYRGGQQWLAGFFINVPFRVTESIWLAPEINMFWQLSRHENAAGLMGESVFAPFSFLGGVAILFGGMEISPEDERELRVRHDE